MKSYVLIAVHFHFQFDISFLKKNIFWSTNKLLMLELCNMKTICRYHSEVRQEAVQQALAAMQDKPKQVVPLPSKRASVARPVSHLVPGDDDHDDMDDDDSDIDDDHDDHDDILCETRNLALGLSDTSSAGSLASSHRAAPPPSANESRELPPPPTNENNRTRTSSTTENKAAPSSNDSEPSEHNYDNAPAAITRNSIQSRPMPPLPPSPPAHSTPVNKPLPPSPDPSPVHQRSSNINPTYREMDIRDRPRADRERQERRQGRDNRDSDSSRVSGKDNNNGDREAGVEMRQQGNRDSQAVNRPKRSSLIESSQTKSPPQQTDLQQNIEPYDVLFLTKSQQPKVPPHPALTSSTPDVALPGSKQPQSLQQPPPPLPPPVKNQQRQSLIASVQRSNSKVSSSSLSDMDPNGTASRWKVSAKIQQLLDTLRKPKRRPLPEFYEDDDKELELAANNRDPAAPTPEGTAMAPAVGSQLDVPAGLPRNLEAAIQRYGSATYKAPVATVLDPNGKLSITLSYGKLLSRSLKIAYNLLNKIGLNNKTGESQVKSGDRIALVYPNNDPLNMICAFYGCVMAGTVPVPIEVPISRRDAGSQQIGFLLGSCSVNLALTSEACFKGLPKTTTGEVVQFKGWPKLHWFITEHLARPPKDWNPPPRLTDDTPAYVEYTTQQDGSVLGVSVSRTAMLAHARTLTLACNYTEGEIMVCVLDFKRDVGLWHGVLSSVFNGMHVIFIPYALMKVNPASWMQMVTKHRASIAICKSRDLHWGLLATKDHRDLNLGSLRLLLVADGANPWSLSSCDQFLSVFQSKGLRPDAICPCAASTEGLTVSVRRPGREGINATGRGVLSMGGLSHGVVRVDQDTSLTSLTLQDCGQVLPGARIVIIR